MQVHLEMAAGNKTGYVYDADMLRHANPWDPDHIECPDRLRVSHKRCLELGLLDGCERIPSRRAGDEELLLAHSEEHLQNLGRVVCQFKMFHQIVGWGLVDLDLGCSTILPSYSAISAKIPSAEAESGRKRDCQDQSQSNQGLPADETPCKMLC